LCLLAQANRQAHDAAESDDISPVTRFPKPLSVGDLIAITAPSSGVSGPALVRLDLVLGHLRSLGFRIVEGDCLRSEQKNASAPRDRRAQELMRFLTDPTVSAILPPWGGELASELLLLLDFETLRSVQPKWLLGFSDLSTLQVPLTLISGWATAHGSNMMDLAPTQTDHLTTATLSVLAADLSRPVRQESSTLYQKKWIDYAVQADAPLNLTESTRWQRLDGSGAPLTFRGRLIGGCLDTIAWLAGSKYGDIPSFIQASGKRGTILYLENVELAPPGLVRALLALRRHRWFDGLSGLLIGRSAGPVPDSPAHLSYAEALAATLGDLPCPVLYDVDIGHQPPQFTLINGAFAEIHFEAGRGSVVQCDRI
jgi:muramoyltetrapeptide carboxypeptidase LdcA involved in peptidoglycan recycling